MKSWRTTASGVIAAVIVCLTAVGAIIDGDPATNPDWAGVGAALVMGYGLFAARDNKVTSEAAGAVPAPAK